MLENIKPISFNESLERDIRQYAKSIGVNDEVRIKNTIDTMLLKVENNSKLSEGTISIKDKFAHRTSKYVVPYPKAWENVLGKHFNIKLASNGSVYDGSIDSIVKYNLEKKAKQRKAFKDKMKQSAVEGDHVKEKMFDNSQKVVKELSNSLYGVLNVSAFSLFNSYSANAITAIGRDQGEMIIRASELAIGGNFKFENTTDLMNYVMVNSQLPEGVTVEDIDILKGLVDFTSILDNKETIVNELTIDFENTIDTNINKIKENIKKVLMNEYQYIRLACIGKAEELIIGYTPIKSYADKGDYEAILKDEMFKKLSLLTVPLDITNPSFLVRNFTRKCTVLSDTDSAYNSMDKSALYLSDISKDMDLTKLKEKFPFARDESLQAFFTYNILGEYSGYLTDAVLGKLSDNLWFSGTDTYDWKVESLMRIAITKKKKTYAYIGLINEYIPQPDKIKLKNLEKQTHSKHSIKQQKEFLTLMFNTKYKKDLLPKALEFIFKAKDEILIMIEKGELFLHPSFKARSKVFYENAYGQWQSYIKIASELITKLDIPSESRLHQIPLINFNTVKDKTAAEAQLEFFKETSPEFYDRLQHAFKEDPLFEEAYQRSSLKQIGIPQAEDKIPDYIIPLIDKTEVVQKSVIKRLDMWLATLGIEVKSGRINNISSVNLL